MAIVLSRALYTHYKRSKNDFPFSTASTAMPPSYNDDRVFATQPVSTSNDKDELTLALTESHYSADDEPGMAILPQYITTHPTTLIIRESFPPLRHGCFDVTDETGEPLLFKVDHAIPSFSRRRLILDGASDAKLLTVRRDVGSLPKSYYIEDPHEHKVLELQGKFYVPFQGYRSNAAFVNAMTGARVELLMRGSWLNRNVEIVEKASGRVVARAEREILSVRNAVGGRTTYTACVDRGVDMTIVLGLIMALDERAD